MFDEKSRYLHVESYLMKDHRGREVLVVSVPPAPMQEVRGYHLIKQGQRLDHLAHAYLHDAAGFWRIAEINDWMLPDSFFDQQEIAIPQKKII